MLLLPLLAAFVSQDSARPRCVTILHFMLAACSAAAGTQPRQPAGSKNSLLLMASPANLTESSCRLCPAEVVQQQAIRHEGEREFLLSMPGLLQLSHRSGRVARA